MNATVAATPLTAETASKSRIASIDLIRGAVMILMAIDHVRVYSGIPAGGPTAGVFFTRWITHFCAPAFIFLAGTSIFLYARKHDHVSRYLLIRGTWLILLEFTFLRLAWTFNFDFRHYEMAGVIWVIGICMILMAGLVKTATGCSRNDWCGDHRRPQPDGPAHARAAGRARPKPALRSLENHVCRIFCRPDPVWPGWTQPDRALFHHSLDWGHGGRLRLRQDPDLGARAQKAALPDDRTLGHRTLSCAPRI